ncbi:MAG: hypothetical protein WB624_24720, partial [Xanthobacteraceae bacterium]
GDADGAAFDASRRPVGIRRRRSGRPLGAAAASEAAIEVPAKQAKPGPLPSALLFRGAQWVKEQFAVEMIGNRTLVVARHEGNIGVAAPRSRRLTERAAAPIFRPLSLND